jgi:hypothetical protein
MQDTYVDGNGKEIGLLRWRWRRCQCKDGASKARVRGRWHVARPAQVRGGQCDNGIAKEVMGKTENGLARAPVNDQYRRGKRGATAAQC